MLNLKNWQLTLGLGLIASLMNDVFYNLIRDLIGIHINLTNYYSLWLIPQNATLLNLNLGFAVISVSSWMMSLSIYLRVAFHCWVAMEFNITEKSQMQKTQNLLQAASMALCVDWQLGSTLILFCPRTVRENKKQNTNFSHIINLGSQLFCLVVGTCHGESFAVSKARARYE